MIYLGSDHAGFKLKQKVMKHLAKKGYVYTDIGNKKLVKSVIHQVSALNLHKHNTFFSCRSLFVYFYREI